MISFLLQTEIIPLCLRIMENGSELSKTVAIFIVQKILSDDTGLVSTFDVPCPRHDPLTIDRGRSISVRHMSGFMPWRPY